MSKYVIGLCLGAILWILGCVAWMGAHGLTEFTPPSWTLIFIPLFGLIFGEYLEP